jgi:predicted HTH transcriptional regulator
MADEFLVLKTREDLQRLVDEGLEESLTLDYKSSAALTRDSAPINELCKDVSALANSAGGQLIYGIEEDTKKGKPRSVDDGVTDPKITRERFGRYSPESELVMLTLSFVDPDSKPT